MCGDVFVGFYDDFVVIGQVEVQGFVVQVFGDQFELYVFIGVDVECVDFEEFGQYFFVVVVQCMQQD